MKSLKEADFDAFNFSVSKLTKGEKALLMKESYLEFLKPLKRTADELGLICNQVHGSFVPKKYGDEEYNTATFARIVREMEAAAFMGTPVIVIHALKTLALQSEVGAFASVKPQKKL